MKRLLLITFIFVAGIFALGACSSNTATLPTSPVFLNPTIIIETPTPAVTCSIVSAEPTPTPQASSYSPPVSGTDFSFGPAEAPVTLVEYCDFQSAGCRSLSIVIADLMQNRQDVRFVFRPFPLSGVAGMDKTERAVLAALAADKQGKFWTMYDLLFVKYDAWTKLKPGEFDSWAVREAQEAGLDGGQLRVAMNAPDTTTRMTSLYEAAKQIGIPAVPLILINGILQPSYLLDYQNLNDAVGLIALGKKQFSTCPPFNVDSSKQYTAVIHTEKGDILIELLPEKAPLAVNSFIFLARQGWFDGVTFHRVIPGFAAQAGDPSGTGRGNPGYLFNNEISDLIYDRPGMVGMANSGPDTNGSQFFITFAPAPHLDGGYTLFARVIKGLAIVEQLRPRDPAQNPALPPGDKILSVEIEEK